MKTIILLLLLTISLNAETVDRETLKKILSDNGFNLNNIGFRLEEYVLIPKSELDSFHPDMRQYMTTKAYWEDFYADKSLPSNPVNQCRFQANYVNSLVETHKSFGVIEARLKSGKKNIEGKFIAHAFNIAVCEDGKVYLIDYTPSSNLLPLQKGVWVKWHKPVLVSDANGFIINSSYVRF